MLHKKRVPHFFLNTPMATLCEFVAQAETMVPQDRKVRCLLHEFLLMYPVMCPCGQHSCHEDTICCSMHIFCFS